MYKLQFVQEFAEAGREDFLELEQKFADLESVEAGFVRGTRYVSYLGNLANNTFIWECEFETLEDAIKALQTIKENDKHDELFALQSKYFIRSYTSIFKRVCNQ